LHFEFGDILVIELVTIVTEDVYIMAAADSNRFAFKHFFFNFTTPTPVLESKPPYFEKEVNSHI